MGKPGADTDRLLIQRSILVIALWFRTRKGLSGPTEIASDTRAFKTQKSQIKENCIKLF